jgi:hypothetical protein
LSAALQLSTWGVAAGVAPRGLELWLDAIVPFPSGFLQGVQLRAAGGTEGSLGDEALQAGVFMPLEAEGAPASFTLTLATATGEECRVNALRLDGVAVPVSCRTLTAVEVATAQTEANRQACAALAKARPQITAEVDRCDCNGQALESGAARYAGHSGLLEQDCRAALPAP